MLILGQWSKKKHGTNLKKNNMGNNEIAILINKIKLDKELMILDINFIAFKEFIKIINENNFIH